MHFLKVLLGSSEVNQLFLDPGSAQRRRARVIKSAKSGDFPNNWVMTNWTSRGVHDKVKLYFYVLSYVSKEKGRTVAENVQSGQNIFLKTLNFLHFFHLIPIRIKINFHFSRAGLLTLHHNLVRFYSSYPEGPMRIRKEKKIHLEHYQKLRIGKMSQFYP